MLVLEKPLGWNEEFASVTKSDSELLRRRSSASRRWFTKQRNEEERMSKDRLDVEWKSLRVEFRLRISEGGLLRDSNNPLLNLTKPTRNGTPHEDRTSRFPRYPVKSTSTAGGFDKMADQTTPSQSDMKPIRSAQRRSPTSSKTTIRRQSAR